MAEPALIVVCGAPASGKTTLARRLAGDLRLPLLEKDPIKESISDVFPARDRDASRMIGAASFQVLYDLTLAMLSRGTSVIMEANPAIPYAEAPLARLGGAGRMLIVQCEAEPAVIERRYRERASQGGRHPVHFDLDALPELTAWLGSGAYDLTPLGHEVLPVRTDDGYSPGYGAILEALLRHLAPE
jgi:predicted kinase